LIKPSLSVLDELVGGAPRTPAGIAACARELQRAGAQDILIPLGDGGAVLVPASGDALYLPAAPVEPVQPVGMNDSMAAGWLYAKAHHFSTPDALRFAAAAGTAAMLSAWLPDRHAVESALARTEQPRPCQ
ncbi:PfkB family carbohydrate kinase, partial [Agathobaculum sp.]|uniref:PfkB family carbohydrate kinase n=1 Tax=Agathobaculum sp. TaxID=2048138 RepID=UPI0027BAA3FB